MSERERECEKQEAPTEDGSLATAGRRWFTGDSRKRVGVPLTQRLRPPAGHPVPCYSFAGASSPATATARRDGSTWRRSASRTAAVGVASTASGKASISLGGRP